MSQTRMFYRVSPKSKFSSVSSQGKNRYGVSKESETETSRVLGSRGGVADRNTDGLTETWTIELEGG